MSAQTILQHIQRLFKRKDEPPPVKERYPLDVKEALHAQYEAGKQAGLKEQAGLAGINVLEALHRKFQAGIQAGMRLGSLRCNKGHPLSAMREQSPGIFISTCETCSTRASAFIDKVPTRVLNLPVGEWRKRYLHSPSDTHELPSILSPKKGDAPEKR